MDVKKVKRQLTEMETIFANHISNKESIHAKKRGGVKDHKDHNFISDKSSSTQT